MNENKPRRRANAARAAQKSAYRKSGLSRLVLMVTMMALVAVVSIGGTLAWLQASTKEVVNTFTSGDINITLQEHDYNPETNELDESREPVTQNEDYKIIPGRVLPKDPYLTVLANSEASWVFVQITTENWNTKMTYTVDPQHWTQLKNNANADVVGVYYKKMDATAADPVNLNILQDQKIFVANTIEKNEITADKKPVMKLIGYAIQQYGNADAYTAWNNINKTPVTGN